MMTKPLRTFTTSLDVITENRTLAGSSVGPLQFYARNGLGHAEIAGCHRRTFLRTGWNVSRYRWSEVDCLRANHKSIRHFLLQRLDEKTCLRHFLFHLFAKTFKQNIKQNNNTIEWSKKFLFLFRKITIFNLKLNFQ